VPHESSNSSNKREEPELARDSGPSLNGQLAELAARQHGVVTRAQIPLAGGTIAHRVKAGHLHRVHRGVYAVGHARLSEKGAWMAAVLAAGEGAALAGESAARLWKSWRRAEREIHVVVEGNRRQQTGFRLHTTTRLDPRDVTVHDGIPVTTMARTLVDLAATLTEQQLTNVIHEAAFRNRFNARATRAAMTRAGGRKRSVLERAIRAHETGSAGTRSDLEDRFLLLIASLPVPQVNVEVLPGIEVDFAWPGLVVELDGPGHERARTKAQDRIRDAALQAADIEPLRITHLDDPKRLLSAIRARVGLP
jgi:hypothetical protein